MDTESTATVRGLNDQYNSSNTINYKGDNLTLEEVQMALRQMKNRKATRLDGVNTEFLKYGGTLLELRLL